jgi:hypothetical protein
LYSGLHRIKVEKAIGPEVWVLVLNGTRISSATPTFAATSRSEKTSQYQYISLASINVPYRDGIELWCVFPEILP